MQETLKMCNLKNTDPKIMKPSLLYSEKSNISTKNIKHHVYSAFSQGFDLIKQIVKTLEIEGKTEEQLH